MLQHPQCAQGAGRRGERARGGRLAPLPRLERRSCAPSGSGPIHAARQPAQLVAGSEAENKMKLLT